jgi:hypothetical protein
MASNQFTDFHIAPFRGVCCTLHSVRAAPEGGDRSPPDRLHFLMLAPYKPRNSWAAMLALRSDFLILFPNCTGSALYVTPQILRGNACNTSVHSAVWKFFLVVAPASPDRFARADDWVRILRSKRKEFYALKARFLLGAPDDDASDPLGAVNNLSTFIFGLIRAIGLILLAFGIVQIGLSLKSHDPSQRANGFLTFAGGIVIAFTKEILTLITG